MTDYLLDYSELEARVIASYPTGWFKDNAPSKRFHTFNTFQNYLDMANMVLELHRHVDTPTTHIKYTTTIVEKPLKKQITKAAEFRNIKVQVQTPEMSEIVQKELFKQGCYWRTMNGVFVEHDRTTKHTHSKFLFVDHNGELTRTDSKTHFDRVPHKEVLIELGEHEVIEMVPMVVKKTKVNAVYLAKETVEFNGKQYIKEDLEKALALLESV